jgi:hypothetical protein
LDRSEAELCSRHAIAPLVIPSLFRLPQDQQPPGPRNTTFYVECLSYIDSLTMKSAPSAPACASPPSAQEGDDCAAGPDDEERRGRLLRRALSSFGSISIIYFLGILVVDGRPMSPIGYVATFNTVCSIFLYAYLCSACSKAALWRTAVLFAVQIDVTIFFLGLVYTEPYSDVTHWLLLVPLHLLFVVGKRAGVVATLVVFIQAAIIYLHHYLHPNQTFFATSPASTFHVSIMGRSLNMLSYLVIVSSVSFTSEDARCVALSSLSRVNARLQKATLAKAQFLANMTHGSIADLSI